MMNYNLFRMKKYVELVPAVNSFHTHLESIENLPIDGINIPDIQNPKRPMYEIKHAIKIAHRNFFSVIPHIRACNHANLRSLEKIWDENLPEKILIVSGDGSLITPKNTLELIESIKEKYEHITIYTALDQYRNPDEKAEIRTLMDKITAGSSGFWTQPFFDIETTLEWQDRIRNTENGESIEIYSGFTPVETESSKKYWENTNRVRFSENFSLSKTQQIEISRSVQEFLRSYSKNNHIYLMPIRDPDPSKYVQNFL